MTWIGLPEGYTDSPAVFSLVVRVSLKDLQVADDSRVLQYVDDLLIMSETEEGCWTATCRLLQHLAVKGFKVSRTKLQLCKTEVKYLGFLLPKGHRRLSDDCITVVKTSQLPATKQAVLAFLGLINYCRQWIPDSLIMTSN